MPRKREKQTKDYNKAFPSAMRELMDKHSTTQNDLADYLNKTRQAISYYCDGSSSPDWETIVKIADYFGVSTDYLLGRTSDPHISPAATDDLHLSADSIKQMKYFTCNEQHAAELSSLMEDRLFWSIIREIIAYKNASIAEGIYDSIKLKHHTTDEDSCMDEMLSEEKIKSELTVAINNDILDLVTRHYLSSLLYLDSLGSQEDSYSDHAFALNFVPSEIHEQRAKKYLQFLLESVNQNDPIHSLHNVYIEAAKAGHIYYDQHGQAHYSSRKRKDDE